MTFRSPGPRPGSSPEKVCSPASQVSTKIVSTGVKLLERFQTICLTNRLWLVQEAKYLRLITTTKRVLGVSEALHHPSCPVFLHREESQQIRPTERVLLLALANLWVPGTSLHQFTSTTLVSVAELLQILTQSTITRTARVSRAVLARAAKLGLQVARASQAPRKTEASSCQLLTINQQPSER